MEPTILEKQTTTMINDRIHYMIVMLPVISLFSLLFTVHKHFAVVVVCWNCDLSLNTKYWILNTFYNCNRNEGFDIQLNNNDGNHSVLCLTITFSHETSKLEWISFANSFDLNMGMSIEHGTAHISYSKTETKKWRYIICISRAKHGDSILDSWNQNDYTKRRWRDEEMCVCVLHKNMEWRIEPRNMADINCCLHYSVLF